jgi:hypothetical protein
LFIENHSYIHLETGYLSKLLANAAVKSHIARHELEILSHLALVVNTVSMEEAVQQQAQTTEEAP